MKLPVFQFNLPNAIREYHSFALCVCFYAWKGNDNRLFLKLDFPQNSNSVHFKSQDLLINPWKDAADATKKILANERNQKLHTNWKQYCVVRKRMLKECQDVLENGLFADIWWQNFYRIQILRKSKFTMLPAAIFSSGHKSKQIEYHMNCMYLKNEGTLTFLLLTCSLFHC